MFDDTVSSLHHALLLAALRTHRQSLQALAEVAEGAVLLRPPAPVALHDRVTRLHHDRLVIPLAGNLLLSLFHFLCLLPLSCFLFRHIDL